MSSYTTIGKTIVCPCYKEKITLSGKYYFTENTANPYEVKFHYATCPIIENSKLPAFEQDEQYKYLKCLQSSGHCDELFNFPKILDAEKTTCIK